jgi:outer membrane protein assembly factor BamD (BamD/ComL family)
MLQKLLFTLGVCFLFTSSSEAAFTLKNGRFVKAEVQATLSLDEHYALGIEAINEGKWDEAVEHFNILSTTFPHTPYGQEASYYLGMAYYELEEFDLANEAFSQYIKAQSHPKFFMDAIWYKYSIAEKFKNGAKKRFFGSKQLPKWAPAYSLGQTIYDEVIAAVPGHEIAAYALYSKAEMLWKEKDFRGCIDAYQGLIRRFPKHELTPECYLLITKVYLDQSQNEFQNPDILAFAQINLRRFQMAFPGEERLLEAEQDVMAIKEVYANGLYQTGQFYERIRKPCASIIYYKNALSQFPETEIAKLCKERLLRLSPDSLTLQTEEKREEELSAKTSSLSAHQS